MTGQMFIAALALVAVLVVLAWTIVDHLRTEADEEPSVPVLLAYSVRHHRAPRRWSR